MGKRRTKRKSAKEVPSPPTAKRRGFGWDAEGFFFTLVEKGRWEREREKGRRGKHDTSFSRLRRPFFGRGKEATSWEDVEKAFSSTRIFRGASPEEEEGVD